MSIKTFILIAVLWGLTSAPTFPLPLVPVTDAHTYIGASDYTVALMVSTPFIEKKSTPRKTNDSKPVALNLLKPSASTVTEPVVSTPSPVSEPEQKALVSLIPSHPFVTYTVQRGDTLSGISLRLTGSSYHWATLMKDNQLDDAYQLSVGQTLKVRQALVKKSVAKPLQPKTKIVSKTVNPAVTKTPPLREVVAHQPDPTPAPPPKPQPEQEDRPVAGTEVVSLGGLSITVNYTIGGEAESSISEIPSIDVDGDLNDPFQIPRYIQSVMAPTQELVKDPPRRSARRTSTVSKQSLKLSAEKPKNTIRPPVQTLSQQNYAVRGIWEKDGEYRALISGRIVGVGDALNGNRITHIEKNQVVLKGPKNEKSILLLE